MDWLEHEQNRKGNIVSEIQSMQARLEAALAENYEIQRMVAEIESHAVDITGTEEQLSASIIKLKSEKKKVTEYFNLPATAADRLHSVITQKRAELLKLATDKIDVATAEINRRIEERRREAGIARLQAEVEALERKREIERAALAAAAEIEKSGDTERAAEIIEDAQRVYVPIVEQYPPEKKIYTDAGTATQRKKKTAIVGDMWALLNAVTMGLIPETIVNINQSVLNTYARQYQPGRVIVKNNGDAVYVGIDIVTETTIITRKKTTGGLKKW